MVWVLLIYLSILYDVLAAAAANEKEEDDDDDGPSSADHQLFTYTSQLVMEYRLYFIIQRILPTVHNFIKAKTSCTNVSIVIN